MNWGVDETLSATPRFLQEMLWAKNRFLSRDMPEEEKRVVLEYADQIPEKYR